MSHSGCNTQFFIVCGSDLESSKYKLNTWGFIHERNCL